MKTQTLDLQFPMQDKARKRAMVGLKAKSAQRILWLILLAVLPTIVITVLTVIAMGAGAVAYLSAAFWGIGFIFLALAVDNIGPSPRGFVISGVALMTLAWLSSRIAPEFAVVAGFLIAAWLVVPSIRFMEPAKD